MFKAQPSLNPEQVHQDHKHIRPQTTISSHRPINVIKFFYSNYPLNLNSHTVTSKEISFLPKSSFAEITPRKLQLLHQQIRQNDPMKQSKIIENIRHIRSQTNIGISEQRVGHFQIFSFEKVNTHNKMTGNSLAESRFIPII